MTEIADDSLPSSKNRKKEQRVKLLNIIIAGDPTEIHKMVRTTEDLVVLRAAAKSPNTAPLTLKMLSVTNNKSLRTNLTKNSNTPYSTLLMLQKLGYEPSDDVMGEAAKTELELRKGVELPEGLPGIYAQEILKTL